MNEELVNFITAIDNYDLYHMTELIKSGISVILDAKSFDYETAHDNYIIFVNIICEEELHGTTDLFGPVRNIYDDIIEPNLTK